MLDFPASPTNGQIFQGANGVLYQWNAAGGLWLNYGVGMNNAIINTTPPANPVAGQLWWSPDLGRMFIWYNDGNSSQWVPTTVTGPSSPVSGADFCAILVGPTALPVGGGVATTMPVVSGNSGGWYVPATGRFTPPAGRYFIYALMYAGGAAAASLVQVQIQKNTVVIQSEQETAQGSSWVNPVAQITIDANGTDFFTMAVSSNVAGDNGLQITFGAFPINVTQIVSVQPGTLQLVSEQVLGVAGNSIAVTIPPSARQVQLEYGQISANTGVNDTVYLQLMQGGTPITTASYETQQLNGTGSTALAQYLTAQIGWILSGGIGGTGSLKCSWLSSTLTGLNGPFLTGQMFEVQTAGVRSMRNLGMFYNAAVSFSTITGFRLTPAANNFAAGSYLRAYVVP